MADNPYAKYLPQGASMGGPVIAPPDPYKQANESRAQQDQGFEAQRVDMERERLRLAQDAERRDQEKAAREAQDAARTDDALSNGKKDAAAQIRRVIDAAKQAKERSHEWLATGFGAETMRGYGGTNAADVASLLNTIGSNTAFDRLQKMRDESKTGGALGAVSEVELQLLRDSIASLSQAQSDGQFRDNMDKVVSAYQTVLDRLEPQAQTERTDTAPALALGGGNDAGGPPPTPFDNGAPGQTIATGSVKRQFDGQLAAAINHAVQKGLPYESVAQLAQSRGYQPPSPQEYAAAIAWQRAHPNSPYNAANPVREVPTTALERTAGSPLGAAGIAAGDAASGFTLDNIIGAAGGDAAQARQTIDNSASANPVASTLGTIGGGALAAMGGEAMLGRAGVTAGLGRAMAADTAYGAAAGAGATDDGNRLVGAVKGAVAGAGGSYVGAKAGNALARVARGVADPSVNALRQQGVNALTVGQTFGNSGRVGAAVKGVEERLSGLPVVGDVVNARRVEGFKQFNTKAFDKALEPIGGTVAGQSGEQAIQTAQDKVSQAFRSALDGKGAVPDSVFTRDLGKSVMQASQIKGVGDTLREELGAIFEPFAGDTVLSGEALDAISRNLRDLKGRFSKSNDAIQSSPRVGKAIDGVERAVFDLFDRQASGTIPEYRAARQAYRRVSILEDAVNKARNQKDRVFTPAQLGQADRSNAVKYTGKRQAAAGNTPFFELQTAAQDVLPNKVPDSGTAGRVLIPLALVGGGSGADGMGAGGAGLTLGTILALAYTKQGQRLLTKPGRGINNAAIARILQAERSGRAIGAAGGATAVALTNQQ